MKNLFILCLLALLPLTYACKNDAAPEAADTTTPAGTTAVQPAAPAAAPAPATATASMGGVQHYICPKNCQGSGGPGQGNCPVCGTAYVHNQAFHDQPAQPSAAPAPGMTPAGAAPTPQPAAEPAQNAAGVWHYTCSKGCAGGAGSAVACGKCGTQLVHNTAYHN